MTPEERAMEVLREIITAARSKGSDEAVRIYLAALREAVKAEREGAAATAEAARRDASTGGAYAVWNRACNRIAAAIRERPL